MKIYSRDTQGRKIEIEYQQKIIPENEYESPITIRNYSDFKNCLVKEREQEEYPSESRNPKYKEALGKLLRENHEKYSEYQEQLRNELNGK